MVWLQILRSSIWTIESKLELFWLNTNLKSLDLKSEYTQTEPNLCSTITILKISQKFIFTITCASMKTFLKNSKLLKARTLSEDWEHERKARGEDTTEVLCD